jgi:hypothetical protein
MDLLQNATDDQIAMMGCFVALVTSAALMYVSVYLNRTQRTTKIRRDAGHTMPTVSRTDSAAESTKRKVA